MTSMEAKLFAQTTGRWLCNNTLLQDLNFKRFNVAALEEIACRALDAKRCTQWEKIGEGSFNKVFLLTFDDDRKAAVRIPNNLVPNVESTIASEVATMKYVRERLASMRSFPSPPKVLHWDSSPSNPAGTPYIIHEYVEGVPLRSRWLKIEGDFARSTMMKVYFFERYLTSDKFCQSGSLYFSDATDDSVSRQSIYRADHEDARNAHIHAALTGKYTIGPSTDRLWWRGAYSSIPANRGPWLDMPTMIRSAVDFQLQALSVDAVMQNPLNRSRPSDIPMLRRILEICGSLSELIVPSRFHAALPTLNHPDISFNNFIVSPEGSDMAPRSIDWQGAVIQPYINCIGIPPDMVYNGSIFQMPETLDDDLVWPENLNTMAPEEREEVQLQSRLITRYIGYLKVIQLFSFGRFALFTLPHANSLASFTMDILRCIAMGPQPLLESLLLIQEKWDLVMSACDHDPTTPCPVDFSEAEMSTIRRDKDRREQYEGNCELLFANLGCAGDGWVSNEHYDVAEKRMKELEAGWNEDEMSGPFPLYEGAWSPNLV